MSNYDANLLTPFTGRARRTASATPRSPKVQKLAEEISEATAQPKAVRVTELELDVLRSFTLQDHLDGQHPVDAEVWVNCITDHTQKVKGKGLSAVMGSLYRKSLIKEQGDGSTCSLTQAGYDAVVPPTYFVNGEPTSLGDLFAANDEESLSYDQRLQISRLAHGEHLVVTSGGSAGTIIVSRGVAVKPEEHVAEEVQVSPEEAPAAAPRGKAELLRSSTETLLTEAAKLTAEGEDSTAIAAVRALPTAAAQHRAAKTLLAGLRQRHMVPQDEPVKPASRRRRPTPAPVEVEDLAAAISALNRQPEAEDEVQAAPVDLQDGDPVVRQVVEKLYGAEEDGQSEPAELGEREQALLAKLYPGDQATGLTVYRKSEREFDLKISGPGFRAWLPLAAIRSLSWTSPRIASRTDHPEMAAAGDWSGVRDTDRDTLWTIFSDELAGLLGSPAAARRKGPKSAPRTARADAPAAPAKKVSAKKTGKPAAAARPTSSGATRGKSQVLGYGAAPLARWMGAQGWSFAETTAVLAGFGVTMQKRPLYHRFLEGRNAEKRAAVGKVDPIATPSAADVKTLEARRPKVAATA